MENAPKGIANLGNTCYLNACIQILARIEPLSDLVINKAIQNPTKVETQLWKQWKDIQFILQNSTNPKEMVYPNGFVTAIQSVSRSQNKSFLQSNSQEDISEFFLFFIESLHKCISRNMNIQISGHSENETDNLAIEIYKNMKTYYEKEYSEIIEMFTGMEVTIIESILTNPTIVHSKNPHIFHILNLHIPAKENLSLYDCLDEYCSVELLNGENKWFNEKTNQKEDVRKYVKFWSFPKVLVISFQRITWDGKKINAKIQYDHELDLRNYVCGYRKQENKYELFGVCNHSGSPDNGHYTAFVKKDENWFFCNDEQIQIVSDVNHIITPYAYCLFYMKKNNKV